MKKDISANLYQKFLILCSKIIKWAGTGKKRVAMEKDFLIVVSVLLFLSTWRAQMYIWCCRPWCKRRIKTSRRCWIIKFALLSWWLICVHRVVPSSGILHLFNYLTTKFQWFLLQIDWGSSIYILDVLLSWVYDIINHLICMFYPLFKLNIFGTNTIICEQKTAFLFSRGILCDTPK